MSERSRISPEQRRLMLNFVKKHPIIATGRGDHSDGSKVRNKLLSEMAVLLNDAETGPSKSAEKWLRSWQDWKSDTKKKANEIARYSGETNIMLTDLEQDLVDFLSSITNLEMPTHQPEAHDKVLEPGPQSPLLSAEDYNSDEITSDPIRVKIEDETHMYEPSSKKRRVDSDSVEDRMVCAMERQAASTMEVARQLGRLADVVALYLKGRTQPAGSNEF